MDQITHSCPRHAVFWRLYLYFQPSIFALPIPVRFFVVKIMASLVVDWSFPSTCTSAIRLTKKIIIFNENTALMDDDLSNVFRAAQPDMRVILNEKNKWGGKIESKWGKCSYMEYLNSYCSIIAGTISDENISLSFYLDGTLLVSLVSMNRIGRVHAGS